MGLNGNIILGDTGHSYMGAAMETRMVYPGKARTIQARYEQIKYLTGLLSGAGIPARIWAYCIAQIMHESNDLASPLSQNYSNLSGIKYSANGYARRAIPSGGLKGFADYQYGTSAAAGDKLWAKDYARVLSMGAKPISATTAQEFLSRLEKNGYFTQKEAKAYYPAFNAKLRNYATVMNTYAAATGQKPQEGAVIKPNEVAELQAHIQDVDKSKGAAELLKDKLTFDNLFTKHPILSGVVITVLATLAIKTISSRR